jgi:hypothetical protein
MNHAIMKETSNIVKKYGNLEYLNPESKNFGEMPESPVYKTKAEFEKSQVDLCKEFGLISAVPFIGGV